MVYYISNRCMYYLYVFTILYATLINIQGVPENVIFYKTLPQHNFSFAIYKTFYMFFLQPWAWFSNCVPFSTFFQPIFSCLHFCPNSNCQTQIYSVVSNLTSLNTGLSSPLRERKTKVRDIIYSVGGAGLLMLNLSCLSKHTTHLGGGFN